MAPELRFQLIAGDGKVLVDELVGTDLIEVVATEHAGITDACRDQDRSVTLIVRDPDLDDKIIYWLTLPP